MLQAPLSTSADRRGRVAQRPHLYSAAPARAAGRTWLAGGSDAVGLVAQRGTRASCEEVGAQTAAAAAMTAQKKKVSVRSNGQLTRTDGGAGPGLGLGQPQCLCASARCEHWLTDSLCDSINPVVHLRSAQSGTIGQFESPPPAQVTVCRLTVTLTTLQCERLLPSTNHSDCSPESPPRDADNKVE